MIVPGPEGRVVDLDSDPAAETATEDFSLFLRPDRIEYFTFHRMFFEIVVREANGLVYSNNLQCQHNRNAQSLFSACIAVPHRLLPVRSTCSAPNDRSQC